MVCFGCACVPCVVLYSLCDVVCVCVISPRPLAQGKRRARPTDKGKKADSAFGTGPHTSTMLFIKSCKSLVKGFMPRCVSVLFLILALLLGFLVYYQGQGLEPIDALYLTIVTISTVGYGDISPSDACVDDEGNDASSSAKCAGLRVFTIFYILVGCGYVFSQLANLFEGVLKAFSSLVKKAIDRFDTTDKAVDTTGDGMADTKVAGRSEGLSGSARDLTGDGKADFIEPPTAMVYWAQELMPAVYLLMALQLVSAGIFTVCIPGLDFGTALYHCFITATTVGYGDVAMSTQAQPSGRSVGPSGMAPRGPASGGAARRQWPLTRLPLYAGPRRGFSRACTSSSRSRGWQH